MEWTGREGDLCTHCELVFAGIAAFDRHLIRKGRQPGPARHAHPGEVGLHLDATGKWSATDAAATARLKALADRRTGKPQQAEGSEPAAFQGTGRTQTPGPGEMAEPSAIPGTP